MGRDSASCSSTNCAASVDNDCINTPPRSEAITSPTGNISVGTGTAVSFAGSAVDPDGFPLTTWAIRTARAPSSAVRCSHSWKFNPAGLRE